MSLSLSDLFRSIDLDPAWGGLAVGAILGWVACRLRTSGGETPPVVAPVESASALRSETPRPVARPEVQGLPASTTTRTVHRVSFQIDGQEHLLEGDQAEALQAALREHRKIEAVKIVREATGMGLKEAKDLVDALAAAGG